MVASCCWFLPVARSGGTAGASLTGVDCRVLAGSFHLRECGVWNTVWIRGHDSAGSHFLRQILKRRERREMPQRAQRKVFKREGRYGHAKVTKGVFFFSSRRRHTRWTGDWSSDVCSSDLGSVSSLLDCAVVSADEAG